MAFLQGVHFWVFVGGANLAENQKDRLVSAEISPEAIPKQLLGSVEPFYLVAETTAIRFPQEFYSTLSDYFCHCIARNAADLRSHVRRILLELEWGRAGNLFAALLDLFLALENRGLDLRQHLLTAVKNVLDVHQYNLLSQSLTKGLDPIHVPIVHGSVLNRGIEGRLNLLRPALERSVGLRDALLEAREYLEYSQIDEARNLLESAVIQEPQRPELHLELLEIYRSTRDKNRFSEMSQQLEGVTNPVSEAWQKLAQFFRESP